MKRKGIRRLAVLLAAVLCTVLAGCDSLTQEQINAVSQLFKDTDININVNIADGSKETGTEAEEEKPKHMEYSFATKEEGIEYLMSNKEYYAGFSQNELEFKLGKKNADMDEYLEYAKEQVLDFTDEEKDKIDELMAYIEEVLSENGYVLPDLEPIVFISTTQKEENGSGAYTHGTQIYYNMKWLTDPENEDRAKTTMAHEIFHCITRSNPEFRKEMYKLIHFTVQEEDFVIPPSVEEYFISNPDVEHHNSYATFTIDGKKIDCFAALVSTRHFEKEGDSFFSCMTTALVPIDGSDVYYTPEDTSDFYDVFGDNTGYVIDPEECMADNFSFAIVYGAEGPDGNGYPTQEIIDGIIDYLKQGTEK